MFSPLRNLTNYLVFCSSSKDADKLTYVLKFNKLVVEGGGTLKIESNGHFPVVLEGDEIEVQSGGHIDADMVVFRVTSLTVHQEGSITSNYKVGTVEMFSSICTKSGLSLTEPCGRPATNVCCICC